MLVSVSYSRLNTTTRQRNILAVLVCVLSASVGLLSFLLVSQDTKIILTPTLLSENGISSHRPGPEYLEAATRDVANLWLNRHPNNRTYFKENILRLTHPSTHGQIDAALREMERRLLATKQATVFFPHEIYVDPENLKSEISGQLTTYIGSDKYGSERRTYRAEWRYDAMRLQLLDFYPIDAADAEGDDIPLERKSSEEKS